MRSIAEKYAIVPGAGVVVFDPATLTIAAMGATAIGGAASAAGTLAGGEASASATEAGGAWAARAGVMPKEAAEGQAKGQEFEAAQNEQNAVQAVAAAQRQMLSDQEKARFAGSASRALAGASGIDTGTGSAAVNEGAIAQRGSFNALMDMFNGRSTEAAMIDRARGLRYSAVLTRYGGEAAMEEGQAKQRIAQMTAEGTREASKLSAIGTLAGSAGSMASTYGKFAFPTSKGNFGA